MSKLILYPEGILNHPYKDNLINGAQNRVLNNYYLENGPEDWIEINFEGRTYREAVDLLQNLDFLQEEMQHLICCLHPNEFELSY